MTTKLINKSQILAATVAAASFTGIASQNISAADLFQATELPQGYQVAMSHGAKSMEGKCGEGKCGGDMKAKAKKAMEGKCGEGKCGGDMKTKAKKAMEGKCGEGKCGGNK